MSFIKLYVVSYCAFTKTHVANNPDQPMAYWEHAPDMLSANSIDEAGEEAKEQLAAKWPKDRGWSMRTAVIAPITKRFIEQMSQLNSLGAFGHRLDEPEEDPIKVDLDSPTSYV
jgi:hypothetical protein